MSLGCEKHSEPPRPTGAGSAATQRALPLDFQCCLKGTYRMTRPVSPAADSARVAAPGRAGGPAARILGRRLALRVTLQALLLGLLLTTVLAVNIVDFLSRQQATEDLERQLLEVASH